MSMNMQRQIKQNVEELKDYVSDLYDWEQQMEQRNKIKIQKLNEFPSNEYLKEVIATKTKENIEKETEKNKPPELIRDKTTVREYYNAWDKFDVDKEIERLEEEETRPYRPYNPYEDVRNQRRAQPKTKITVTNRRIIVDSPIALKEKGNRHFKNSEIEEAIVCYTECITKLESETQNVEKTSLLATVYSNRAMAALRKKDTVNALEDCNKSLKLDPKYAKSYFRKGQCESKMGKYKESAESYRKAYELEPNDEAVVLELRRVEALLERRCKEAREALIIEYTPEMLINSTRIQIEDCDSLIEEASSNYLEEL